MQRHVDLNSDMGEGFGPWLIGDGADEQIMALITSTNVATGFHAGDPNIMRKTVQMAKAHNVGIGAHPGFRDLVGFGRRHINAPPQELVNDIIYQIGALREFTRLEGVSLHHVKPHGSLYMFAAQDETLSRLLIQALQTLDPALPIYCMQQSITYRVAQEMGHPTVREFYADRDYSMTGSIVFARHGDRLDPAAVAAKVVRACVEGKVHTVEGRDTAIDFDSICVHSDTPGALHILQVIRKSLQDAGISFRSAVGCVKN